MDPADDEISLRPLRVEDAAAMVDVLAGEELYTHIGGTPPTEEQLTRLYEHQTIGFSPDGRQQWLNWIVIAGDDEPVGYVQASRDTDAPVAEIAWVIGTPWQRRGYASRAAGLLLHELALLGVEAVVADIHPDNTASQRVARRAGMAPTEEIVDGEVRWRGTVAPR